MVSKWQLKNQILWKYFVFSNFILLNIFTLRRHIWIMRRLMMSSLRLESRKTYFFFPETCSYKYEHNLNIIVSISTFEFSSMQITSKCCLRVGIPIYNIFFSFDLISIFLIKNSFPSYNIHWEKLFLPKILTFSS